MSATNEFTMRYRSFKDGPFGPDEVIGRYYEGPFGPFEVAPIENGTRTLLRGRELAEAGLAWGPEARAAVGGSGDRVLKNGIEGHAGNLPVKVRWQDGWRRSRRLIIAELPDRPTRLLRMRRVATFSLETGEGNRLAKRHDDRKGSVSSVADATDVALFLLVLTAELHQEVYMQALLW